MHSNHDEQPDEKSDDAAMKLAMTLLDRADLTPAQRHAALLAEAGHDPALLAKAGRLLDELGEAALPAGGTVVRRVAGRLQPLLPADAPTEASSSTEAEPTGRVGERLLDPLTDDDPVELDNYDVLARLGRGGQGVVYLARESSDGPTQGRVVALKVLVSIQERADETTATREAEREAERAFDFECYTQRRMQHEGVARLLSSGRVAQSPSQVARWIATELVGQATARYDEEGNSRYALRGGETVTAYARRAKLSFDQRLDLTASVAEAVAACHAAGLSHLDLKPDNILVDHEGRPRVVDFGLARLRAEMSRKQEGVHADEHVLGQTIPDGMDLLAAAPMVGTPQWMAPEQIDPAIGAIGPATDVWALGVVAHELLAGCLPFGLDNADRGFPLAQAITQAELATPSRHTPQGPTWPRLKRRDLDAVLAQSLRRAPGDRYASAGAMAEDLRAVESLRPVQAKRRSRLYESGRFVARHRLPVTIAAAGVFGITLFSVVASVERDRAEFQRGLAVQESDRATAASREANRSRLDAQLSEAEVLLRAGQWQACLDTLDLIDEPTATGALMRATCELATGDDEAATGALDSIATLNPSRSLQAVAQLRRAEVLWLTEQGRAVVLLRDVLRDGLLPPAEQAYAKALLAESVAEARMHLQETLRLRPMHPGAVVMAALVEAMSFNRDELARRCYVWRALWPSDARPHVLQSILAAAAGDAEAVTRHLAEAEPVLGDDERQAMTSTFALFDIARRHLEGNATVVDLGRAALHLRAVAPAMNRVAARGNLPGIRARFLPELDQVTSMAGHLLTFNEAAVTEQLRVLNGKIASGELTFFFLTQQIDYVAIVRNGDEAKWQEVRRELERIIAMPSILDDRRLPRMVLILLDAAWCNARGQSLEGDELAALRAEVEAVLSEGGFVSNTTYGLSPLMLVRAVHNAGQPTLAKLIAHDWAFREPDHPDLAAALAME